MIIAIHSRKARYEEAPAHDGVARTLGHLVDHVEEGLHQNKVDCAAHPRH